MTRSFAELGNFKEFKNDRQNKQHFLYKLMSQFKQYSKNKASQAYVIDYREASQLKVRGWEFLQRVTEVILR